MSLRPVLIIAALLGLIGLSLFSYKVVVLGFPLVPNETTDVWTVEARIAFEALPGSVKVSLQIPTLTPGYTVFKENFVSPSFGFTTLYTASGRTAQWAVRQAEGPQTLYYRAVVYRDRANLREDTTPTLPPVPVLDEPYNTAMQVLVDEVRAASADAATFTSELLRRLNDPSPDQNVALFLSQVTTPTELAQAASTLLAGNRIPSRLVRGIQLLEQQRNAAIVPWLEIHDGDRWLYFNPTSGEPAWTRSSTSSSCAVASTIGQSASAASIASTRSGTSVPGVRMPSQISAPGTWRRASAERTTRITPSPSHGLTGCRGARGRTRHHHRLPPQRTDRERARCARRDSQPGDNRR